MHEFQGFTDNAGDTLTEGREKPHKRSTNNHGEQSAGEGESRITLGHKATSPSWVRVGALPAARAVNLK